MRVWRYALGTLGVTAVVFGLRGLVTGGPATSWPVPMIWLIGGVLAHDLVLVPLVAGTGWLLARLVPAAVRPVVRGGLLVVAVVTLVALPVLSGNGDPSNPSLTPLDYPRNWAIVVAAIAAVTAVLVALRWRRPGWPRRSRPTPGA